MKTVFLRVLEADDKATALLGAVRDPERAKGWQRFEVDTRSFASVPRSPFAYWVTDGVRLLFANLPAVANDGRVARLGASSKNDFRYLRLSWERPCESSVACYGAKSWLPLAKGGAHSVFYADVYLVINWRNNAHEIEAELLGKYTFLETSADMHLLRKNPYGRPGVTWSLRTTSRLSMRALPAGCVFGSKGPSCFVMDDDKDELLALLSIVVSRPFLALTELQLAAADAAARSYEVGVIQSTPVPICTVSDKTALALLSLRGWNLRRSMDTRTETSHAFTLPALLQVEGVTLAIRTAAWAEKDRIINAELAAIQAEIDAKCFDLYGFDEADRRAIAEGFGGHANVSTEVAKLPAELDSDLDEDGEAEGGADAVSLAAELVSWAIGVVFGRFDVRLATGDRGLLAEPEPFDPLPVYAPGMLTGEDGLPLASAPASYPLAFLANGILVDDPGHPHDLATAVRTVFEMIFSASTDALWQEAASLLSPKGHDLRVWLASNFFEHHLKRYSKSRRKAPILWQLGTPSGHYSVWLYAHRLTRDSFFQLQNEVVGPKVTHEERQLTSLMQNAGHSPSAAERKEIAVQEAVVDELRAMLDEVKRVAPLWNPNLDDGVVLTMAPLWRLVPQHKPWQKELRAKWNELAAGKYDWAHLAMHLWPERVVPKCATDRSLAIAHGLEDVFWAEGADGKWQQRSVPMRSADELVRERTSPSVKAALQSLLDAPVVGSNGRGRGRSSATAAATGGHA